jgi:hypothetical protein
MMGRQRRRENSVGTSIDGPISRHFHIVFDVAYASLNLSNTRLC